MRRAAAWLAVFACWTLLALLFASQALLYYAYAGNHVRTWRVVAPALADWYLWAALTPGIAWLARRVPIVSRRWPRALLVHVPVSIAVAMLKLALRVLVGRWVPSLATMGFGPVVMAQLHLNVITYWVIAGLSQAVGYYRLEAKLAQAQLDVLRMQLHPHFLFNTLHAISTLVRKDPDGAERTIAQLSDLLRVTLDTLGRQKSTVQEEIDFVGRYLAIQQTRFGDRLVVRHLVEPDTLDALLPTQILQPLVENAIRHGIGPRASGGAVEIRISRRGGQLMVRVADNGVGAAAGSVRQGLGLSNTRARLTELYGAGERLVVSSPAGGGFTVIVTIPYERATAVAES
jgi:signal transduction histidine kinase